MQRRSDVAFTFAWRWLSRAEHTAKCIDVTVSSCTLRSSVVCSNSYHFSFPSLFSKAFPASHLLMWSWCRWALVHIVLMYPACQSTQLNPSSTSRNNPDHLPSSSASFCHISSAVASFHLHLCSVYLSFKSNPLSLASPHFSAAVIYMAHLSSQKRGESVFITRIHDCQLT